MNYTQQDIELMKRTKRLKLSTWQTFEHYSIVMFLCLPLLFTLYSIGSAYFGFDEGGRSVSELLPLPVPFIILALIAFFNQRRRLKFTTIHILNTHNDVREALRRTAQSLQWRIETERPDYIRAFRTEPWIGNTGEMVTIIKDGNTLLLNSISDLNRKPTFSSFGWDKKNINTFLFNLAQTLQNIPANSWYEDRESRKWYAKKYFRYIAYFFSACVVPLSVFLAVEGEFVMAVILLAMASFYIYSDISLMMEERSQK
jgi:hypothetical protein